MEQSNTTQRFARVLFFFTYRIFLLDKYFKEAFKIHYRLNRFQVSSFIASRRKIFAVDHRFAALLIDDALFSSVSWTVRRSSRISQFLWIGVQTEETEQRLASIYNYVFLIFEIMFVILYRSVWVPRNGHRLWRGIAKQCGLDSGLGSSHGYFSNFANHFTSGISFGYFHASIFRTRLEKCERSAMFLHSCLCLCVLVAVCSTYSIRLGHIMATMAQNLSFRGLCWLHRWTDDLFESI